MSLLGLGEYGASDSDSTPAGQQQQSPAIATEGVDSAAAGDNPELDLKKSLSIVGNDYGEGDGEGDTPKGKDSVAGQFDIPTEPSSHISQLMPPSPVGQVQQQLQARCEKLFATTQTINFNNHLRQSHAFRNPEILPKLVEQRELDQFASCYPKEIFDPEAYDQTCFFDAVYREQNRMLAARQAKAKEAKAKEATKAGKPPVQKIVSGNPPNLQRQSSTGSGSAGFGTRSDAGEPSKKRTAAHA